MARPSQRPQRRQDSVAALAATFAEFGYRRTTTAQLAARCGVQENVLYRLWPDKRAMFVAALDHVYQRSIGAWQGLLVGGRAGAAVRILEYEAVHHGEHGLYRLVFAGLSEVDDEVVGAAMRRLYSRFQKFVSAQVRAHRGTGVGRRPAVRDAASVAWAIVGLGTVANIGRELRLLSPRARRRLFLTVGRTLLEG